MIEVFKKYWWMILGLAVIGSVVWWSLENPKQIVISPEAPWIVVEKPLEKYSFPKLRQEVFLGSEIEIDGNPLAGEAGKFFYQADGKKISGQIHLPTGSVSRGSGTMPVGGWPVVIMIRGYVDREIYQTGMGTQNAAGFFASQGFMTLAPDFLGFGESDEAPNNSLHERLLRPGQVLELIASVKNLKEANAKNISIWGHSNGGQIALSVLEISGKDYPTTLWAPVSKPFPYSVLYYTDEYDDYGKALRKVIAGFEALYDADEFSIHQYYDLINAPIQIHQGTIDDAVPLEWSVELEENLKDLEKEVELNIYEGADHNLVGAWNTAVAKDVEWFRKN